MPPSSPESHNERVGAGAHYPGMRVTLFALLGAFLLAIALTECYRVVAILTEKSLWESAAIVHTALAILVLAGKSRWRVPDRTVITVGRYSLPLLVAFIPALVVFFAALFASMASSTRSDTSVWTADAWLMILWIPFVEELVFRVGLGGFFRRRLGILNGGYISAVLFALVHGLPGVTELFRGNLTLPLGPLVLGLCNEALYAKTGRLAPIVCLHAACNATAVIFRTFDPRWLDWLGWFYL